MKTYRKLFIIFFNCVFSISMFSQGQEIIKETELETEIKNLISKKNNFKEFKTEKIASYKDIIEYGTNVRPLNWSYKLSVLKNSINHTSAFVYTNNVDMEGVYFFVRLSEFLIDKSKSWKQVYEQEKVKSISRVTITYKGKAIGFMQHDTRNYACKVILFIGNLKMEDIDTYLAAQKEEEKLDFFKESNTTEKIQGETKKDTTDFFKDLTAFLDSISPPKKIMDSAEKAKAEKEALLAFVSQFDSVDIGKWAVDEEKNAADIKNIQQSLMLLVGQRVIGFDDMKKGIQSKTTELVYYYTTPNVLMKASSEYVIEKNSKNSYCAFYDNEKEKALSLKAFLAMPSVNKSTIPLRVESGKLTSTSIEKTRYNLYISDKLAASYFINKNDNSIQVYEPGY